MIHILTFQMKKLGTERGSNVPKATQHVSINTGAQPAVTVSMSGCCVGELVILEAAGAWREVAGNMGPEIV